MMIFFFNAVNKKENLLKFWINSNDSTLRMAIRENLVYKVPGHIRKNKWHHICQSWNGLLGEWQIFLDGKRIGRGILPMVTNKQNFPIQNDVSPVHETLNIFNFLFQYKETYIPEKGDVVLGQEYNINSEKNAVVEYEGITGEIFGFNLVDESVPVEQGNFINSQYKPSKFFFSF